MVKTAEFFIVGKGRKWLMTSQPAAWADPPAHIWSIYTYDAEKMEDPEKARGIAEIVGGAVFRFNPATGKVVRVEAGAEPVAEKAEEAETEPEKATEEATGGAVCDTCWWYRAGDGTCRNGDSRNYREYVCCFTDGCGHWREKDGRKGHGDTEAHQRDRQMEKPGA